MPPEREHARFQRARWSIYGILALSYMLVFFHRMAPAVVAPQLSAAFATSGASLGLLAAMYYCLYTAMQLPAGVLADTLGARRVVTVGNLTAGVGSVLFGLAQTFAQAAAGRLLVGLGVSVVFVGLMRSNTVWFRARDYGLVSGLTVLLGNLGALAAAGPLALLLQVASWRTVFVALGVAAWALALASALWVRNRPEELGFRSPQAGSGAAVRSQHWLRDLLGVLRNRAIWPAFWANLGLVGSMLSFLGLWAVPYLRDVHGLAVPAASLYTTVGLAGFAGGCLFAGWLSDRIGRRRPVLVAGTLLQTLICTAWVAGLFHPGALGLASYALFGLSAAGFVVNFAVAKELTALALAGMAIALVNTGSFLGAAILQPLFGWVMDLAGPNTVVDGVRVYGASHYQAGLWLLAASAVLGLACAWRVPETGWAKRRP
ncbi:MAG TPA: MFS transporter [Candidatus Competibacteraceae bacterium]|nr:MFS transporter [Candidatus Competibacteraceae bacterium]